MADRVLFRYGSIFAIVGAVLAFVANFLHPRYAPEVLNDPAAYLADIATHGVWALDHMAIVVAELLILFGFIAISRSFSGEPGSTWAHLGL